MIILNEATKWYNSLPYSKKQEISLRHFSCNCNLLTIFGIELLYNIEVLKQPYIV
jgi:hypothetical protein